MQVPIPVSFEPDPATLPEDLSTVPPSNGIYSLTTPGHQPHISWSINLRRRLNRLLLPSYTASSEKLNSFAEKIANVRYWRVSSRLETSLILYELTRDSYPDSYLRRLHLRIPWFIGLTQSNAFARLAVSNRVGSGDSPRFGPFRTRDMALVYQEHLQGLHQVRRCVETLSVSPDHPGCIYGEMNQCLRPCQCAVSPEEYATEAQRVNDFLSTAGKSALLALTTARDRAAADLDYEQAALAHKRMEKVQAAIAARDPVVARVQTFNGIAVTRANEADSVNLWPLVAGLWQTPINLYLPGNQEQGARSLDSMLRQRIQVALEAPESTGSRVEHLALFSRWYYSSWRDGHWFPFEAPQQLNYRRLVKAISSTAQASTRPA